MNRLQDEGSLVFGSTANLERMAGCKLQFQFEI